MSNHFKALLPSGFYDLLPPAAAAEARVVAACMKTFAGFGYEHVKPPLVEFEESLLASAGTVAERQTFRLMDPVSQRMMGLRADITMQIGRIALTRLQAKARPLRLCYTGTVLHTKADALNPARQHTQAGIELVGVDSVASDAEAIIVAVRALQALKVKGLSVDLNLPSLAGALVESIGLPKKKREAVLSALANKNLSPLETLENRHKALLQTLCGAVGPVKTVLPMLKALKLPAECAAMCARLEALVRLLKPLAPEVAITLDPTENRGFDYHGGIGFSIFAAGIDGEIGRGGRYAIAFDNATPAIGATLYISRLLPVLKARKGKPRVYLPSGTSLEVALSLQAEGYATVAGLEDGAGKPVKKNLLDEAKRMNCQALWWDGGVLPLEQVGK